MGYPHKTFRPSKTVLELIEDIEYGKRSDFVNRCCELHGHQVNKEIKEKKDFPDGSKESKASPEQKTASSDSSTQSNAQDHTQSKPIVTPEQNTHRLLKKYLQQGES